MNIASKTLLQVISQLRSIRVLLFPRNEARAARQTPMLVLVAATLALLLAILEVDLHRPALQAAGVLGNSLAIDPVFLGP